VGTRSVIAHPTP
jgi:hypothetical protein